MPINKSAKTRRIRLIALNLCTVCGQREPEKGRKRCAGCAEKNREAVNASPSQVARKLYVRIAETEVTRKKIGKLSAEDRVAVEKIVSAHKVACYKLGIVPENLDRAYLEAMELVEIEKRERSEKGFPFDRHAARNYSDQYFAGKVIGI